jgi:UDP-N-acetylglucosamine transferase subunit ALG13
VGSTQFPFDRLMRDLSALELDEPLVVQTGPSDAFRGRGTTVDFMDFADVRGHMECARVVITHGGVGSILLAVTVGHTPVVVPRLRSHGEAVDDHQLELSDRLGHEGRVIVVKEHVSLHEAVDRCPPRGVPEVRQTCALAQHVNRDVVRILEERAGATA